MRNAAAHVRLIGTGLYQDLIERAVRRAKGETPAEAETPDLRIGIAVFIPEQYVPEEEVRIHLYQRLASLLSEAEVADLAEEMADRFGPLPEAVQSSLALVAIRVRCRRLNISRVEAGPLAIAASFSVGGRGIAKSRIGRSNLGDQLRWSEGRLIQNIETSRPEDRLAAVERLLTVVEELS